MKTYTEDYLKDVDKRINSTAFRKADEEDYYKKVLLQETLETLWELRWAIISHMELQEKLK